MSIWDKVEDVTSDIGRSVLGDDVYEAVTYNAGDLVDDLKEPGKLAKEAAKDAAEIDRLSTAESVRIMEEENARTVSTAKVRAGASGLSGASTEMYLAALEETGQKDVEWLKTVGAANYQNRVTEGRLAQVQAQAQMWGTGASVIGAGTSAIKLFG